MIEEGSSADEVPLDVSLGAPVEAFLRLIRGRHKPDILIRLESHKPGKKA